MTPLDDALRDAFTAHRADTPTSGEIGTAVNRARRPQFHRRRRPLIAAAATATVLAGIGLASLPGDDDATRSTAGVDVLRTAAAAAAEQPAGDPFAGFRYARSLDRWTYGTSTAAVTLEQEEETWVDRRLHGRRQVRAGRIVKLEGDPTAAERLARQQRRSGYFLESRTDEYVYGDGGTIDKLGVDRLPTDPAALAKTLREAQPDTLRVSEAERRFYVARELLTLLTQANASPELRSAAFNALAQMEGVKARGPAKDERGRPGEAVEIAFPLHANPPEPDGPPKYAGKVLGGSNAMHPDAIQVIVDPDSGDILSWTQAKEIAFEPVTPQNKGENAQLLAQTHVYLSTGQVDRVGER